jgi:hypothetical protein
MYSYKYIDLDSNIGLTVARTVFGVTGAMFV